MNNLYFYAHLKLDITSLKMPSHLDKDIKFAKHFLLQLFPEC